MHSVPPSRHLAPTRKAVPASNHNTATPTRICSHETTQLQICSMLAPLVAEGVANALSIRPAATHNRPAATHNTTGSSTQKTVMHSGNQACRNIPLLGFIECMHKSDTKNPPPHTPTSPTQAPKGQQQQQRQQRQHQRQHTRQQDTSDDTNKSAFASSVGATPQGGMRCVLMTVQDTLGS